MSERFLKNHIQETIEIARNLDAGVMSQMVDRLVRGRTEGGRLFICGVGGSAANCSHAVNDFRKLARIESYAPTDNVSELTARTNDEGWERVFADWLLVNNPTRKDVVFIMSVGGGSRERNISVNLVEVIDEAKRKGVDVLGIVGRDGGYTRERGDIVLLIPSVNAAKVTPHTEAFQAVVWHALVSDPRLTLTENKWESER